MPLLMVPILALVYVLKKVIPSNVQMVLVPFLLHHHHAAHRLPGSALCRSGSVTAWVPDWHG